MRLILPIILWASVVPASCTAGSGEVEAKPSNSDKVEEFFRFNDKNGDGKISKEELKLSINYPGQNLVTNNADLEKIFQNYDKNHDNYIGKGELTSILDNAYPGQK